jgi:hypothetical protein
MTRSLTATSHRIVARIACATLCLSLVGCVQKAYDRTVLFVVDVSGVPNVTTVGVRGENKPLSWREDTPMTAVPDSAGLYTVAVTTHTGGLATEVKFVVNGTFEFSDSQDDSNRKVSLPRTTTGGDTIRFRAVYGKR